MLPGADELAAFLLHPLEQNGSNRAVLVRQRLQRAHPLDESNAFLERFGDFLVIEPVGGRFSEAAAVVDRDTAPFADQLRQVGRLAGGPRPSALAADGAPMGEEGP